MNDNATINITKFEIDISFFELPEMISDKKF